MSWMMAGQAALTVIGARAQAKAGAKIAGQRAYQETSTYLANQFRSTQVMAAATSNIAAARMDKILATRAILDAEAEAIANAKVAAAAAGVEGGSVEDVKNSMHSSAGMRIQDAIRTEKTEKASLVAQIYGASYDASQPLTLTKPTNPGASALIGLAGKALDNGSAGKMWDWGKTQVAKWSI